MARLKEREKALNLRKQGMSYSQIKKALGISKSTLSGWLRDYPLGKEKIKELRDCNEQRIERFRETMRKKKQDRLNVFYKDEKLKIIPLSKKELYLAGLFLYWGEGSKTAETRLVMSNTDPSIIKFFIVWLEKCWGISKDKLKIQLHLYKDMDVRQEIYFWSKKLGISLSQFNKPYIKNSFIKNINHKRGFGHGTCNLTIGNARLSEKVFAGLRVVRELY